MTHEDFGLESRDPNALARVLQASEGSLRSSMVFKLEMHLDFNCGVQSAAVLTT